MLQILRRYWPAWVGLGVVLTLVYLPARLVVPFLPSQVQLAGLTGTLWQGRAARASVSVSGQTFMLGGTSWRLEPLSLLRLQPTAAIHSQWGSQTVDAHVGVSWRGNLVLEEVAAAVDIGWARQLLPLYVEGRVRAEMEYMELDGQQLQSAQGRIVWERAAWAARAGSLPLGTYVIELTGEDQQVTGDVVTLNGGLQVEGTVVLDGPAYDLSLRLAGPAMRNDGLQQAMALFALPNGDSYSIDLRGSL